MAESLIPSPSRLASCIMDSCISTLFLRRCSPKVLGAVG
jgi:hypothetical protein